MTDERLYWIWLSTVPGLGPTLIHNLLLHFRDPVSIYHAELCEMMSIPGIGYSRASAIESSRDLTKAQLIMNDCISSGVSVTYPGDTAYPQRLAAIPSMPAVLYYKGTLQQADDTVGIVGPRACSRPARDKAIEIAEDFASKGYTIISGMAAGIDAYSHTSAIKKDARTIAVLGCGPDICYPAAHRKLYEAIVEQGAVISEYPPHTKPRDFFFPLRNRIIACMSDSVYVIGAERNSGSLITADYAESFGRDVHIISC